MKPLLGAELVSARHAGVDRDVLRDVSVSVAPGEILALVGPNGSGKSTLLAVLASQIAPRTGRVVLGGADLRSFSSRERARRIAFLPQNPATPEGLAVEALVRCGRHAHRARISQRDAAGPLAIERALSAVELSELRDRPLEQLSGGERRRAWIAMVLAQEPGVLLLDEPTGSLDVRHQWDVLELLRAQSRERGIAVVVSLHELEHAALVADRVAVLSRGRVYESGAPRDVLGAETLRDVFRIEARTCIESDRIHIRVLGTAEPLRAL